MTRSRPCPPPASLTRASIYLALIGPVFSTMNWVAETQTLRSARTVDVFPTGVPKRSAPVPQMNMLTQDGRMGPLQLGMTVQEAEASIKKSGIEGLKIRPFDSDGYGLFTAVFNSSGSVAGAFNNEGRLHMIFGPSGATIDGLRGGQPLAPFEKRYGSALSFQHSGHGADWAVVTFETGVRLQLQDAYTSSGEVGQLILLSPGAPYFYGEWS